MESLLLADILKLNHEELPRLLDVLGLPRAEEQAAARLVASRYHLQQVCITRGANGSVLFAGEAVSEHPGYRVQVADTVGAGDAFTAALVHEYLRGASIDNMNNAANRVGSWVASQVGATPVPIPNLQQALAEMVRPSD